MNSKKPFNTMEEAREILGDDFWDVMSDILPFVSPKVDMYRDEYQLLIVIEVPGIVAKDDISLSLQGYTLVVEGSVNREYVKDEEKLVINERMQGSFKRNLRIPQDCAIDKIRADYANGLLYVQIPFIQNRSTRADERIQIHFHT